MRRLFAFQIISCKLVANYIIMVQIWLKCLGIVNKLLGRAGVVVCHLMTFQSHLQTCSSFIGNLDSQNLYSIFPQAQKMLQHSHWLISVPAKLSFFIYTSSWCRDIVFYMKWCLCSLYKSKPNISFRLSFWFPTTRKNKGFFHSLKIKDEVSVGGGSNHCNNVKHVF